MEEKFLKEEENLKENNLLHKKSFSKNFRILKSFDYRLLQLNKKKLIGTYISIDYRLNDLLKNPRIGITISSKTANAVVRNRFKRISREVFRQNKHLLQQNLEINIYARSIPNILKYKDIELDFLSLISLINK